MIFRKSTALGALALTCAAAFAHGATFSRAIEEADPHSLQRALSADISPAERRLAEGLLAAMLNRDSKAEKLLAAAAKDKRLDPPMRRRAAETLSGVRLRIGDFAGAAAMLDDADAIAPLDAAERQTRAFAEPLAEAPKIKRGELTAGQVTITRDIADLPRADAIINGAQEEAVLDTGAAYSTIVESAAQKLNLHFFDGAVSVGAAMVDDVPARVAIADRLEFGGVEFRNVVFIVVPDETLSFADGRYTIETIIGFPVLSRLERLTFETKDGGEQLSFGPSDAKGGTGNLYLEGLVPVVMAEADGSARALDLVLDTGARVTNLSNKALQDNPSLAAGAATESVNVGGAGGTLAADALVIPVLTLRISGTPVTLNNVMALSSGQAGKRDGILGQDVLRSGRGYILDFRAMSLEILPALP